MKDVRTEGEGSSRMRTRGRGFQWKRTSAALAAHTTRNSNSAGQTDVTDTSCTTAPALRQSLAISTGTAVSPPLPGFTHCA